MPKENPLGKRRKAPVRQQQTPFPGLIDGHRWKVRESKWPIYIDRSGDEDWRMHVPLEDTPAGRKMRLQEQAHATWTPNVDPGSFEGVEAATVEACEDGRIIRLMNERSDEWRSVNTEVLAQPGEIRERHGVQMSELAHRLTNPSDEEPLPGGISLLDVGRWLAMTRGYREGREYDRMAIDRGFDWVRDLVNRLHAKYLSDHKPTFDATVAYARELEQALREAEEAIRAQAQELREADMPDCGQPERIEMEDEWGEMTIEKAPLTMRLKADPTKRLMATDMGIIPRYMHRLPVDQRVFGRKRRREQYRGTVLIDHSGSMSLDAWQVDEILRRWPAVTIATYCGDSSGHGVLRIVASKGKRATNSWLERPSSGDNVIDGPALDWLAKQRGPRVWISDGRVTGKQCGVTPGLLLDAARKVNRGRITRIPNVQDLLRS